MADQQVRPGQPAVAPELLDELCRVVALAEVLAAKHAKQAFESHPVNGGNRHYL